MTIRENERPRQRARTSTSLTDLAVEIVRDDPEASDGKLARRWAVRVQDDDELLAACLKEQGARAIAIARSLINHEQIEEENVGVTSVKQHKRRKKAAAAVLSRAAVEVRKTLFNLVAENGKKIRDLTGDELDKLESSNVARANLYRELRKQVKGDQIVGEVLDDEHFKRIVDHIGDVKELVELFD
jgi:hypothetical protein